MVKLSDKFRKMIEEAQKIDSMCLVCDLIVRERHIALNQVDYLEWESDGQISYMPANRVLAEESANWTSSARQKSRPGRVIRALFTCYLTDSAVERFVYNLDSVIESRTNTFELVSREDIRYWYNGNTYDGDRDTGSLRNSCMRYDKCSTFFDVYVENPDKIRMLIVKRFGGSRIIGRALVWTTDTGETLVDRIYGRKSTIEAVKVWAREQGFWHKESQTYDSPRRWITPEGYRETKSFRVTVSNGLHRSYPYMDTFQYISLKTTGNTTSGVLTNYSRNRSTELTFDLQYTDGEPLLSRCTECNVIRSGDGDMCYDCAQRNRCYRCSDYCGAANLVAGLCQSCANRNTCPTCQGTSVGPISRRDGINRECESCYRSRMASGRLCHCGLPISHRLVTDVGGNYLCDTCSMERVCTSCRQYVPYGEPMRTQQQLRSPYRGIVVHRENHESHLCRSCSVCAVCAWGEDLTVRDVFVDAPNGLTVETTTLCDICENDLSQAGVLAPQRDTSLTTSL